MKNLPIQQLSNLLSSVEAAKPKEPVIVEQRLEGQAADAIVVNLPRVQGLSAYRNDPSVALDSFLNNVGSNEQSFSAHSGLDPARVMSLLDED